MDAFDIAVVGSGFGGSLMAKVAEIAQRACEIGAVRYGHPRAEVLARLGDAGTCTFRTDYEGAISFYLDEGGVTSARWGSRRTAMEFPPRWIPPQQAGHCGMFR